MAGRRFSTKQRSISLDKSAVEVRLATYQLIWQQKRHVGSIMGEEYDPNSRYVNWARQDLRLSLNGDL